MKVVVAGASGLVGGAAVAHFAELPGWEVVAVSRRGNVTVPGVVNVTADLNNREQCECVFSELRDVTHVVYAAIWDGSHFSASERDDVEGNHEMFKNIVEPLEQASPGLEHVSVVHGTAAYPIHSEAILPRLRESDPRGDFASFYFLQEDYLEERKAQRKWSWTIWRATWIFGDRLGASMNAIPALGVYGALLRERGEPLRFPGNPDWRVIREACDVDLFAEAFAWAATSPMARYQTYNVSNGDQFEWRDMWPVIADAIGMEVGEPQPMCLGEEIPKLRHEWAAIVEKYELTASPDPLDVGGESFAFLDQLDGYYKEPDLRMQLSSTVKLREHGFSKCIDTEDMFRKHFRALQRDGILPHPEAAGRRQARDPVTVA